MFPEVADHSSWGSGLESVPYGLEMADWCKRHIYTRIWSFAWAYHNQAHSMMDLQPLTEIARRGVLGKSYAALRPEVALLEAETERNGFYDRLRFPLRTPIWLNLSSSVRKGMEAECERSLALSAIALKRFALKQGRLPENLDALVPDFLSEVPTDYMDGMPIRYRLRDGGDFTLYSVGTDGVDEGGDGSPSGKPADLYHQAERKDLVWPSVARPDEVEAFRKELSKGRP